MIENVRCVSGVLRTINMSISINLIRYGTVSYTRLLLLLSSSTYFFFFLLLLISFRFCFLNNERTNGHITLIESNVFTDVTRRPEVKISTVIYSARIITSFSFIAQWAITASYTHNNNVTYLLSTLSCNCNNGYGETLYETQ